MKRLERISTIAAVCTFGLAMAAAAVNAADDNKLSVSVAFGRGLNTAQPGNAANDVVIPDTIRLKKDGVVHFLVAGFHQIIVYNPGKVDDDVVVPGSGLFINDPNGQFYTGITPAGGPPPGLPIMTDPSNARNRVESVSFAAPGTYLVICNVRNHFNNGMFGYVEVK